MVDDLTNLDRCNLLVAHLFTTLHQHFPLQYEPPLPECIQVAFPGRQVDIVAWSKRDRDSEVVLVCDTVQFLIRESFLIGASREMMLISGRQPRLHPLTLTSKSLLLLNAIPDELVGKENLGTRLRRNVSEKAGSAAISETVSLLFRLGLSYVSPAG